MDKHIRLDQSTYTRLSLVKRDYSFSAYISLMLNYFAVTNIAPESLQEHAFLSIKKDIERIITIQKAQERDYFKLIPKFLKSENLSVKNSESKLSDDERITSDDLSVEELQALLLKLELAQQEIVRLNDENTKLVREKESIKANINQDANGINKTVIIQCVEALKDKAKATRVEPGMLHISNADFNSLLDRILKECL